MEFFIANSSGQAAAPVTVDKTMIGLADLQPFIAPQQESRVIKIQTATPYLMIDNPLTAIRSEEDNTLINSGSKKTPVAFSSVPTSPKPLLQPSQMSTPGKTLA